MLSIVYSSSAVAAFDQQSLAELLTRSRASNHASRLTGLLMFRQGRFLQVLEGDDDQVRALMERIERDPRHTDVRVLIEEHIAERQFPDWSMGYERVVDPEVRVPGYRRSFIDIDADRSSVGTLPAIRALIAWFREHQSEVG